MAAPASRPRHAAEVLAGLPSGIGAGLRTAAELARVRTLERFLPVPESLGGLFPEGFPRGGFLAVVGDGATSVTARLVSEATRTGSWLALVDLEHAGYGAFAEAGVALERTVAVRTGIRGTDVVGALVGGFDLIVVGALPRCSPAEAGRLAARVRAESCTMIAVGDEAASTIRADATVRCGPSRWEFDACARRRHLPVSVTGRGSVAATRNIEMWLP